MKQLKSVLANDVPEMRKLILEGKDLFPEYTGKVPVGPVAYAKRVNDSIWPNNGSQENIKWQICTHGDTSQFKWTANYDANALYVIVTDTTDINQKASKSSISEITVKLEPRRLWPLAQFRFDQPGKTHSENEFDVVKKSGKSYSIIRIPFKTFWWNDEKIHALRLNVYVRETNGKESSWCADHPVTDRLVFGSDNPADLGWLKLE